MTATLNSETANVPETGLHSGPSSYRETYFYHETSDSPADRDFASDESGVGTIETVLILVVLISLVLIFQTQMKSIINNVFKTINSGVGEVKLK